MEQLQPLQSSHHVYLLVDLHREVFGVAKASTPRGQARHLQCQGVDLAGSWLASYNTAAHSDFAAALLHEELPTNARRAALGTLRAYHLEALEQALAFLRANGQPRALQVSPLLQVLPADKAQRDALLRAQASADTQPVREGAPQQAQEHRDAKRAAEDEKYRTLCDEQVEHAILNAKYATADQLESHEVLEDLNFQLEKLDAAFGGFMELVADTDGGHLELICSDEELQAARPWTLYGYRKQYLMRFHLEQGPLARRLFARLKPGIRGWDLPRAQAL